MINNKIKLAICVIAFNRLNSLQRLLEELNKAYYDESVTLIISIDKGDNNEVVDYAKFYKWYHGDKIVNEHTFNLGLRKHVLSCGDWLEKYDALIVLEDDISIAENFFIYSKQCVNHYKDNDEIAGISLYAFSLNYQNSLPYIPMHADSDVYLMKCAQSWGQVWMKRQWKTFRLWYDKHCDEFKEKVNLPVCISRWPKNSWLKYHTRYCIEENKYFVYPYISHSSNNSDNGVHNNSDFIDTKFQVPMLYGRKENYLINPQIKYDGFFENEAVPEWLGISKNDICIDFYGQKRNREKKHYWLTRENAPYKIVCSFALTLKPYELNILEPKSGRDLFLYDTTIHAKKNKLDNSYSFMKYMYSSVNIKQVVIAYMKEKCNKSFL